MRAIRQSNGSPNGEILIDDAGSDTLSEAFRAAKILAGWEAPVRGFLPGVGSVVVGEPACRNLRGERGDFVGRPRP